VVQLLFARRLFCQPLRDPLLQQPEYLLHIRESGLGIVVVVHQAMVIIPVRSDFINHKPRLLHCGAAMLKVAGHFIGSFFQCAVKAEGLGVCRSDSRVRTVPLLQRSGDFLRPLHNANIGRCYRRSGVRIVVILAFVRRGLRLKSSGIHQQRRGSNHTRRLTYPGSHCRPTWDTRLLRPRGTSYIFCRSRRGRDRFFRLFPGRGRLAVRAVRRQLPPCGPVPVRGACGA
jgi:hypothetical protein